MTRTVSIFGATGSVGQSTLDLIGRDSAAFEVVALTANSDALGLAEAARTHHARVAIIADESQHQLLRDALAGTGIEALAGRAALLDAARIPVDWSMAAIVGCAGLEPVMAMLELGGTVAIANKEPLVSAGALVTEAARASGATLLPVDSEHNAIFQCLAGGRLAEVRRIVLTASGGPFRTWTREAMARATPAQAVSHPNWMMGAKISVDSATMFNKGLELIEAHHLFPVGLDRIEILIHPQSVVHSLVEYRDFSTLAQLGSPDMRIPIAHALAWPERMATPALPLDLAAIGRLDFEAPDEDRFPATALARAAIAAGGAKPAILNAANEVAVAGFLAGRTGFLEIATIVAETLAQYDPATPHDIGDILAADREARGVATRIMEKVLT